MSIFSKLIGDSNERVLKELRLIVDEINKLEPKFETLSDEELKGQTQKFKDELLQGKTVDDILPEAFAVVREAAKRTIGQRHFDVQLMGGVALHRGQIAEMKTGEGKTLVATCPLYLNALAGKGAHLVTVNDYLARIHADWMGKIYNFLGLSVGCIGQQNVSYRFNSDKKIGEGDEMLDVQHLEICSRKEAYACDILYGTNNEFGFDYLRDNMVGLLDEMVQRELCFAIVDEVDSILIDEARTPLIISAPDMESTDKYYQFSQIVRKLQEGEDYNIDEKMRAATLTEEGMAKVEKSLGVDNIYTDRGISDVHHIEQALKAWTLFKKDRDYVVKDGEIIIIDEFTGRMMFGRRYSEGLHQAIEAKENVAVQKESRTLATISFQNYFRLYQKLSGMTGTAATEAEEFFKIYKLEVVIVPTNQPMIRIDANDRIYKNETGKYQALAREIKERHQNGQPVLVGTISIEKNELLAELLAREGIDPQILNAKHHEKEAHIIAQAGRVGTVTVATNMAGRGVDIILGGHPYDEEEHKKVVASGGLCVLGTERHESRRIDNQLRGRSGRQGDPGLSQFFLSMDDDLMRIFGSGRMKSIMETMGVPDDMPIENKMISKSIEQAQKKVEGNNFDVRKHLVEYDDVMNKQRETIYKKRRQILAGAETKEMILSTVRKEIESVVDFHSGSADENQWNLEEIYETMGTIFILKSQDRVALSEMQLEAGDRERDQMARDRIVGYLYKLAVAAYNELEEKVNLLPNPQSDILPMRQVEKGILLRVIDTFWVEHLETMEYLRTGIGLRGYGQRDPLVEYKREALKMFKELLANIDKQIVYSIYKIGLVAPQEVAVAESQSKNLQFSAPSKESAMKSPMESDDGLAERKEDKIIRDSTHYDGKKVGRNDPCPCGSGKKYKKCHGK
ncbi:MAG: preprotein translocase subunit SecA [Patescibacteria group bacterium]|mgnify:CR=1 FL=1